MRKFEWQWSSSEFTFRGREYLDTEGGDCITMKQHAMSLEGVKLSKARKKHLKDPLAEGEAGELLRCSGEFGWLARQLRLDLAL